MLLIGAALVLFNLPVFAMSESYVNLTISSVTASDQQQGNPPENTLDTSLSTRWSAEGDGQWIAYDLGAITTIGGVKIAWYKGEERMTAFDIEVSDDGFHWTLAYSGHSSGQTTALEPYDFPDTSARYLRIVGHGNTSNRWNSLAEVEIYVLGTRRSPDIFDPQFIRTKMKNVFNYQLANMNPDWVIAENGGKFWIGATFYTGVMAAYNATDDQDYREEAIRWSTLNAWQPGLRPRHADDHAACQTYLDVYFQEQDSSMIRACQANIDAMIENERPGRVDWWWADALYMAPPVLTRLYEATGDEKYIKYLHRMWWDVVDYLYDKEHALFYRDNKARQERTASGKKVFWGRGNGWVMGGLVQVLDYLPTDDPKRVRYEGLLNDMAVALAAQQREDGLWRASLLAPEDFPAPETSSTAFIAYALAWGVNHGVLAPEVYLPVVEKAWEGLNWATTDAGKVGWCQPVGRAPGETQETSTFPYCSGAFLLAASEMLDLLD
jgi:rhamnogalacturonyl hydrolase YesR